MLYGKAERSYNYVHSYILHYIAYSMLLWKKGVVLMNRQRICHATLHDVNNTLNHWMICCEALAKIVFFFINNKIVGLNTKTIPNHMCIRGFTKFGIKVAWRLHFLEKLSTLDLKFQKVRTKIGIFQKKKIFKNINWGDHFL